MQAAQLPASAGLDWIRQGYQLFRQQPMALLTWALTVGFLVVLASMLAPIGPLFFVMFMPAISVMTLEACRRVENGQLLLPMRMFAVLRHPGLLKALLLLGFWYLILMLASGLLIFLPFADTLSSAIEQASTDSPMALYQAVQPVLFLFGLCYVLLAALFWFAPGLIAWEKLGIKRALFYSIVAFWRNKWAFLLYAVAWALAVAAIEILSWLLVSIGLPATLIGLLQLPVNFALSAVLYASIYYTYTGVLGQPATPPLSDAPGSH